MSARVQQLVEAISEEGVDALVVTNLINVRYLTGYTGTNGLAVLGPGVRAFLTDFRYLTQAAEQVDSSFERRRASQNLIDAVPECLPQEPLRLGFEEAHLTVRQHRRLRELLAEEVELIGLTDTVERLRVVKDRREISQIRVASELADEAYEEVVAQGLIGRTEQEVAMALEQEMRRRGAQRASFETIVAAGAHGALPHATPRGVPIARGELVVIDWGAELDGYCSDCTRTVAAGEATEEAREAYQLVLEAQLAGLQAVRAGASCKAVDGVARAVIDAAGRGEQFGHGLGHGVGLDVHEEPRLSQRSEEQLQAGNVVTVEPGVYEPGAFGVRIEDLVVVDDGGCEILTSVPKELRVAG